MRSSSRRLDPVNNDTHLSLSSMVGSRSFASSMACTTSPCIIAYRKSKRSSAKRTSVSHCQLLMVEDRWMSAKSTLRMDRARGKGGVKTDKKASSASTGKTKRRAGGWTRYNLEAVTPAWRVV